MNKSIWVGLVAIAFVTGSLMTGVAVFADDDDKKRNRGIINALNAIADAIKETNQPPQSDSDIVKRQFIQTIASQDGAIQVVKLGGAILYYGDTLCEILSINEGTGVVIHFAMETTVLHLTDCVNQGTGHLFSLEGSLDATFQPGDLLAVENNFDKPPKMVEVHREQTIP